MGMVVCAVLLSDIMKIIIRVPKVNKRWCGEIQRLQRHALYSIQWRVYLLNHLVCQDHQRLEQKTHIT